MKLDKYNLRLFKRVFLWGGLSFTLYSCSGGGTPDAESQSEVAAPEGAHPIRLISPMGLEKWIIGSEQNAEFMINGETAGTAPRVELWKAEAESPSWVSEPSFEDVQHVRRSISIMVPELPAGAYRVRVASTYDANIFDETERAVIIDR